MRQDTILRLRGRLSGLLKKWRRGVCPDRLRPVRDYHSVPYESERKHRAGRTSKLVRWLSEAVDSCERTDSRRAWRLVLPLSNGGIAIENAFSGSRTVRAKADSS